MKVVIKNWHAVAQWRWDNGNDDSEDDVCGICRVPYEGCCPACKMPGDDCPLIWAAVPNGPTSLGDRGAQDRKQVDLHERLASLSFSIPLYHRVDTRRAPSAAHPLTMPQTGTPAAGPHTRRRRGPYVWRRREEASRLNEGLRLIEAATSHLSATPYSSATMSLPPPSSAHCDSSSPHCSPTTAAPH
ncbi:uncharacterized protein SCHCODRAFT_02594253 [Schizophyllum commune H4-8]|uniref:Anaphase-promoting complex subunit 11 RING-H2 finger domain-containing protein n=1 Tax=Schizophyllum commune (strain H4-8 / FGSC 9210) TaxID=578458 RepID=D8QKD3_SCHCM|nr:uncharacterized protein SCHCODRAFT_02594253 [Schizophyllum commune H4-8]KAI5885062.1 hypothetical protein SCHCODRAFT_02594253 [Schizophyllum commune H4-8]